MLRDTLRRKRDGEALDEPALRELVEAIVDGSLDDAGLGAFAMATWQRGMDDAECVALTRAMRDSGHRLDWRGHGLQGPLLDKHSTGGVGDLVSLVLAPMLAACGAHVPMLSGRGLGHTGGTVDKLESIPGYDCQPERALFQRVVADVGLAIVGATDDLAPADRRLYAIRDRTATVSSIPLIVASILSKKLAAGLDALLLDVKRGNGALLAGVGEAERLAHELVSVATRCGLRCEAVLTAMDQPLADCAGNAIEVRAALEVLAGGHGNARLVDTCLDLGSRLLRLAGVADSQDDARVRLQHALSSGAAAERFAAMVAALGGPGDLLERPDRHLATAPVVRALHPAVAGRVAAIDVRALGWIVVDLGGGRRHAGEAIDPAVGLSALPSLGATVDSARPLATIHARDEDDWQFAAARLRAAIHVAAEVPAPQRCASGA
jgi:thymidine phosphorylase